jgi:drug/metabolite transporter (DMT)-like permease
MGSLLLATVSSATIALLFKISSKHAYNEALISMANYGMASVIAFIMFIQDYQNISQAILPTVLLGVLTGLFFFSSFYFYQRCVAQSGASLAGMFGKLGILVPMLLSIVIWRELPSQWATVGILLSFLSIVIVNWSDTSQITLKSKMVYLLLLFAFGGIGEFFNKIFQYYMPVENKGLFLFCVFFSALLFASLFVVYKKTPLKWQAMKWGIVVGIPNLMSSFFLIDALHSLKATIVFPFYSAGSIFLIFVLSFILFQEKIKRKDQIAMAITMMSLVLLNL